ncbi:alpha/beta hydrolase [Saccharothrix sp. Mg75]|uniref:alpha/beta hydrolase n=1 Tax=Saccharothrix sp. Mg75 TaxID=3445357 RepID=UPI003EEAD227
MRWSRSRSFAAVLLAAGLCLVPTPAGAAVSCEEVRVPVTVAGTGQSMAGTLCAPTGASTVQVLIPGGTYNRSYWDVAYEPGTRSYRRAMNGAGIATLAVDRLGTGRSSKPLSALVTATTQAQAVHQVIRTLRPRFSRVVVGGHSIGAAMALVEAGLHRDVDGVLVTGFTHRMNLITVLPVLAGMIPAALDPVLRREHGLDLGYLTTGAGKRYGSFHVPGALVPGAIDFDESTKDVFATTEAVDTIVLNNVVSPFTRLVDAPVMVVVGDDNHFCGLPLGSDCSSGEALRASEAPYFSPAARLSAFVLHGYGHSINYAPNAPDYHRAVVEWTRGLGA